MPRLAQIAILAAGLAGLAGAPAGARADDVQAAAEAFARAQRLSLEGKMAEAADLYELADELQPSAVALRNATRARFAAGHAGMAATDAAALLRRYPDDAAAREVAEAILSELVPQLVRLDVSCDAPCAVMLGDKAASRQRETSHALFVTPGARTVSAVFDTGTAKAHQLTAKAGSHEALTFAAPTQAVEASPAPTARPRRGGLSRAWFITGAVITVGLGAAATYEGLATLDDRDTIRGLVGSGAAADAAYQDAIDRQRLTNTLLVATAAVGVATIATAFFTRWSSSETRAVAVAPSAGGLTVALSGRF